MRARMLGVLSGPQLTGISATIGRYAVSAEPDDAALAKEIDASLSAEERVEILKEYSDFASVQQMAFAQSQARFQAMSARMPADAQMAFPSSKMNIERLDAGCALLEALIPGPNATITRFEGGIEP